MTVRETYSFLIPKDIMQQCAKRVRELRIEQGITQKELAGRIGAAEGTVKRFEHTGEIQFRTLLEIALVLSRLDDFTDLFKKQEITSLYNTKEPVNRQRARKK